MTADVTLKTSNPILVVGAGIGGMQSALLLAEAGYKVYLLDSAPGIGGSLHLLDLTFPTNSCGVCLMLPGRAAYCPTFECELHPNIELITYAWVEDVSGSPGDFTVTVRHKPRYVNPDLCNNCGLCALSCPVERPDRYEGILYPGKAIYSPPPRAVPPTYVIDMDYCTRCGRCVAVCPTGAIDLSPSVEPSISTLQVGAIILAPGFEPFDARLKGEFGFGYYENVLTSIQFERMLSAAGSTGANIVRPSDKLPPRKMAFIQCVGSRDDAIGYGYCSSVCCMYTAKQVAVAKKLRPELEITVFYMDIRAHGKDFDSYFESVAALPGVYYRRCMVSSVHEYRQTRNLQLRYVTDGGELQDEDFDMVVLAVGFAPPAGVQRLAQAAGIALNRYGFCETYGRLINRPFAPDSSSRPGIIVSGAFREPKDIPETVIESSSAAAAAACLVGRLPGARERSVAAGEVAEEEWPRVGVFLCDCRGEIGEVVDLEALAERTRRLRDVVLVQVLEHDCLNGGLKQIEEAVEEHRLNRVVLAGCTARLHQGVLDRMMVAAGLNPGLLERVNLRGEVARVHARPGTQKRFDLVGKASELVEMGVAGARLLRPVYPAPEPVSQRVLVIGGGLAGLTAALTLAQLGHEVDIVERSAELGGQARELRYLLEDGELDAPQLFLRDLIERVEGQERIHVYRGAQVAGFSGRVGQFSTRLLLDDSQSLTLKHGAVIIATGGREVTPTEYLYGQDPRVMTQRQLQAELANFQRGQGAREELSPDSPLANLRTVVMIQCVGSREPDRPYCSRVCCSRAVANALRLKEAFPQLNIFVLYREMRTYGFREDFYRQARSKGVAFLRYELPHKPQVTAGEDGLTVRLRELITGEELVIHADLLVLSTGIAPNDNGTLAELLGVPLDANGFFREEYPKMRPLDLSRRGIFMCGLARAPCSVDEAIVQAQGAAMRAAALLAQEELEAPRTVVQVNQRLCSACGLCVEACPYGARILEPGATSATVIGVLCQGCGVCATVCPNKATQQVGFTPRRVYEMLDVVD